MATFLAKTIKKRVTILGNLIVAGFIGFIIGIIFGISLGVNAALEEAKERRKNDPE